MYWSNTIYNLHKCFINKTRTHVKICTGKTVKGIDIIRIEVTDISK